MYPVLPVCQPIQKSFSGSEGPRNAEETLCEKSPRMSHSIRSTDLLLLRFFKSLPPKVALSGFQSIYVEDSIPLADSCAGLQPASVRARRGLWAVLLGLSPKEGRTRSK